MRFSTCQRVLRTGKQLEVEIAMRLAATLEHAEPRLVRIAERLCASRADAGDLVQDTLERAMRQGIPVDVRNPCAWLTTIMHNLFIDRCRAAARQPGHEPLREAHDNMMTSNHTADDEPQWIRATIEDVRAAAAELEPIYREVYEMYAFDGRSYEYIAKRLGIDRVTVGTRLTRARKKLREVLVKTLGLEIAS
jgi:RNA polymerase sigma-70 factor (ECF subfamily)